MRKPNGMKAMVLAAGVGSRLDPLTRQVPKPLIPFMNRPVMEHTLRLLHQHGITQTISNLHYLPEQVPDYFGNGSALGMQMSYQQEPRLSGDAGGVRACREFLADGTFVVIMGDLVTDMDISYVVRKHKEKNAIATIALKQVEDAQRFGVAVVDGQGFINGFQEKPSRENAKSNLASTGVYVFEPSIFDHLPLDGEIGFGRQVFPSLLEKGLPILGVEVWGYWSDVGTIEQYRASTMDAMDKLIDLNIPGDDFEHGWLGEGATVSESCQLSGVLLLGANSHIGKRVRIKGYAVIGDNCSIEDGTVLEDSIVWSNTIIGGNCRIKNAVIAANCFVSSNSILNGIATIDPKNPHGTEQMPRRIEMARRLSSNVPFICDDLEAAAEGSTTTQLNQQNS